MTLKDHVRTLGQRWLVVLVAAVLGTGVGVAAQMTLVTIPLYMILRDWRGFWISMLVLVVTTAVLKKTWFDRLEDA